MARACGSNRETRVTDRRRWDRNPRLSRPQVVERRPGCGPGSQTSGPCFMWAYKRVARRVGAGRGGLGSLSLGRKRSLCKVNLPVHPAPGPSPAPGLAAVPGTQRLHFVPVGSSSAPSAGQWLPPQTRILVVSLVSKIRGQSFCH